MHTFASILLAMAPEPATNELITALQVQSYSVQHVPLLGDVLPYLQHTSPDVIILGPSQDSEDLCLVLSQLAQSSTLASLPLLVLSEKTLEDCSAQLMPFPIEAILPWPTSVETVLHKLYPLTRLATMQSELWRRQQIIDQGGGRPPLPTNLEHANILVLGTADILHSVTMATDDHATVVHALDLFSAQEMMEKTRFDACVMAASEDNQAALLDLCSQIRRNPRLFNLPVLFISEDGDHAPLNSGATHHLSLPLHPAKLRFSLRSLVRLQQQRWAIRQEMRLTLTAETTAEKAPETYNKAFLERYLALHLTNAEKRSSFSLVGLAFAGVDALRHEFGNMAEAHLLGQIGQWLTLLVRAEDLVAYLGGNRFCVVLPDTPQEEAAIVMNRIAGVISKTDFAVHDVYQVVTTWPYVQAIDLTEGEDASSLIARVDELLQGEQ